LITTALRWEQLYARKGNSPTLSTNLIVGCAQLLTQELTKELLLFRGESLSMTTKSTKGNPEKAF